MNELCLWAKRKAKIKVPLIAGLLLATNFVNAQDTYWALTGDRRLNTATGKVIANRVSSLNPSNSDATFNVQGRGRAIFDATGRCLFTYGGGAITVMGSFNVPGDGTVTENGGVIAFPTNNPDGKCKQYTVINSVAGYVHSTWEVNLQNLDAESLTGINYNSITPTPLLAPIPHLKSAGASSSFKWGVDVTKGPSGTHYVYVIANTPNMPTSECAEISRYTINPDGTYNPIPTVISPINGTLWPQYAGAFKVAENNLSLIYRDELNAGPGVFYNELVKIGLGSTNQILRQYPILGNVYGLAHVNDNWYFSTDDEIGCLISNTGFSQVWSNGAKSDLAIGQNGRIYFAIGDPATVDGTLYSFSPGSSPLPVQGGTNVVYGAGGKYHFGNNVDGENTSIAINYDEYDDFTIPAGTNLTITPTNNPGTWYNGGGTYPTYRFKKDVKIEPSASLTVQGMKVEMAEDAKVFVKNANEKDWGARLKLDNSIITGYTDCQGKPELWSGIEVWGDNTRTQLDQGVNQENYQGRLDVINNSTVSYARLAVQTLRAGDATYTSGGGIFLASNAHFLNNRKSVAYGPYIYASPGNPSIIYAYRSHLTDCEFKNYEPGFVGFISGWSLRGVSIAGCSFVKLGGNTEMNYGINGYDFGFRVGSSRYGGASKFYNLRRGIEDGAIAGNTTTVSVKDANFAYNTIGISLNAINAPVVTGNAFDVPQNMRSLGVDINTGTGYEVSGNGFKSIQNGSNESVGVLITNTGSDDNSVHNNTYDGVTTGNLSTGLNRDASSGVTGLQFTCNYHDKNVTDEAVYGDDPTHGIADMQGSPSFPAGNTFSTSGLGIDNQSASIKYCYYNGDPLKDPTYNGSVNKVPTADDNDCKYSTDDFYQLKKNNGQPTELVKYLHENQEKAINTDVVLELLDNSNSPYSGLAKVDLLLERGALTEASKQYDGIVEAYHLTGKEAAEFATYGRELMNVRIALKETHKDLKNLSSAQIATLERIAAEGTMWAKVRAQNWLRLYDGREYEREILLRNGVTAGASKQGNISRSPDALLSVKVATIYPNPVHDYMSITYLNTTDNRAVIDITDLSGKRLQQQLLEGKSGTIKLDLKNLSIGMYLYKIVDGSTVTSQGKFVKE